MGPPKLWSLWLISRATIEEVVVGLESAGSFPTDEQDQIDSSGLLILQGLGCLVQITMADH